MIFIDFYLQVRDLTQYRNFLIINSNKFIFIFINNFINNLWLFILEGPNAAELATLNSKARKVNEIYERAFQSAVDLGREEELFGYSRAQKEDNDLRQEYLQAIDDQEILGDECPMSPASFFVSLLL